MFGWQNPALRLEGNLLKQTWSGRTKEKNTDVLPLFGHLLEEAEILMVAHRLASCQNQDLPPRQKKKQAHKHIPKAV